jgi:hypothetical protein
MGTHTLKGGVIVCKSLQRTVMSCCSSWKPENRRFYPKVCSKNTVIKGGVFPGVVAQELRCIVLLVRLDYIPVNPHRLCTVRLSSLKPAHSLGCTLAPFARSVPLDCLLSHAPYFSIPKPCCGPLRVPGFGPGSHHRRGFVKMRTDPKSGLRVGRTGLKRTAANTCRVHSVTWLAPVNTILHSDSG